jgi:alpha-tubulin suppressor-like RCC1 family protein/phosphodiesterase/alkaline phosphatase D-like protein
MRFPRFVIALALLGTPVATVVATATSVSAEPLTYTAVSVATRGACALSSDGTVVCWGDNPDRWVFPDRPTGMVRTPTKISLPHGLKWKSINSGEAYANCGIAENDRAYCWGNHHIGSFLTTTSRTPVEVEFPAHIRVTDVQSGHSTACATTTTSELWCWGDAHFLGDGSIDPVRIPVRIPMPDNNPIKTFNMGGGGVCAITTAHNMYCWGSNGDGQLGLGYSQQYPYSFSWTPVLIPTPAGEQWNIASYAGGRLCALTISGNGYCAGDNFEGSFGNGTYEDSMRFTKMVVPNNERLVTIATGWYHTCVGTESGKMWCFGRGGYGELGTGTTLGGRTWRTPFLPDGVTLVSFDAGVAGTCALDTTGRVWCWGGMNWTPQTPTQPAAGLFPELMPPVGSPTIVATGSTRVDAEVATITGQVNPNGYASTVVAEVSASQNFSNATRHSVSTSFPNDVYTPRSFSLSLTSLAPRTVHYVRLVATNTFGTVIGTPTTFTTLGEEPTVGDVSSRQITGMYAVVSTTIHPNRLTTSAYFELSTSEQFLTIFRTIHLASFGGNSSVQQDAPLSDLQPRTRYFVRAVATNRLGTTVGHGSSFVTLGEEPTVENVAARELTGNDAIISGTLHPHHLDTTAYFEISTNQLFNSEVRRVDLESFSGNTAVQREASLTDLQPRTRYYMRAVATNRLGTTTGETQSFTTLGSRPIATITSTSATTSHIDVVATVDSGLAQGTTVAEVSTSPTFTSVIRSTAQTFATRTNGSFSFSFRNLAPRTDYWVRVVAENPVGSQASESRVQRTRGGLPEVRISNVNTGLQSTTVSVVVQSTGLNTFSKVQVSDKADLSDATEYFVSSSAADTEQLFDVPITDLAPGATYYVAAMSRNEAGHTVSRTISFTTPRPFGVVINDDAKDTGATTVSLTITVPTGATAYRVSNHSNFRNAQVLNPSSPLRWELIASSEAQVSRSVYVQVYFANGTSTIYSDSISLLSSVDIPDDEAPIIEALRSSRVTATAQTTTQRTSTSQVAISVSDRRSGVTRIETRASGRTVITKVDAARRGTYSIAIPRGAKTVAVRVRDAAGNYSKWRTVKVR